MPFALNRQCFKALKGDRAGGDAGLAYWTGLDCTGWLADLNLMLLGNILQLDG
jgi:hypothetical protein